ncbi:hypothetical protein U1Q18_038840 [Sarracenia purpurea var. burkii]
MWIGCLFGLEPRNQAPVSGAGYQLEGPSPRMTISVELKLGVWESTSVVVFDKNKGALNQTRHPNPQALRWHLDPLFSNSMLEL